MQSKFSKIKTIQLLNYVMFLQFTDNVNLRPDVINILNSPTDQMNIVGDMNIFIC